MIWGAYVDPSDSNRMEGGVRRDLPALVEWAFRPDGLPNLRVPAWGNFGFFDRWNGVNKLCCRKLDCPVDDFPDKTSNPAQQQRIV